MFKVIGWAIIIIAVYFVVRHYSPNTAGAMRMILDALLSVCQAIATFICGVLGSARGAV